ncbi:ABC transporter ATP-binding protein [Bifidobacterium miconisargentati]|uniref:ABC transporter ATP-binding protein n=1 Tax=Bifidobacterium miconisargentati TaxID=2834437 RepID=UPI001BDC5475|nr:ABC transporter ATP-binding protein [Bifidobacterium miconisargentati]MBW3090952.1 ABC transporter ATP-binding protein [Bifidobacterium miconisargentati]
MPQPQPLSQSQSSRQPHAQQPYAQLPQPQYAPQPVPPSPEAAVSIRGLFKRFGNKIAVNGLSLDIPVGSFYGLVGPNGAGKTTTLNMVTGLLVPDAGLALILGRNVWQDVNAAKRSIGVMPQPDQIFDRLTGLQLLVYAGMLRGMKRAEALSRARDLLNAFDLAQAANTMVSDYSAGMTKKICLASAMIHSPRILVLDEPFESVDPVSSANLKDILIEYAKTGGTVIISSHVMSLVEKMCTHVAVINNGQVCAAGTVDQVAAGQDLEDRFLQLVGGRHAAARLSWLDGGAPHAPASAGSPETSPTPVVPTQAQSLPNPVTPVQPAQSQPNPNETAVR